MLTQQPYYLRVVEALVIILFNKLCVAKKPSYYNYYSYLTNPQAVNNDWVAYELGIFHWSYFLVEKSALVVWTVCCSCTAAVYIFFYYVAV